MAVLLGLPVVRVHRSKPPKSVVCRAPPGLAAHRAVASGPGPLKGCHAAGDRTLNLWSVSPTVRGTAPYERSQSHEESARRHFRGICHTLGRESTPMPPSIARMRWSLVATSRRCI
ncbi:hypothetical protein F7R91_22075 [Streptomyces luteolifulvus]|uniref:Uncharacterized protein n=1 Tax=Streptomyces luteolifulvus TaxID=2615112 RepID=A0A6H9UYC9_9ACTN|nr:hypothetical protein F7R91_22075 [Streptomyces luteolifulvus]